MLYALIASNIAWVVALLFVVKAHNQRLALLDARETARDQNHREHIRHLEDQIVLLKVDPVQAATYAAPPVEDDLPAAAFEDSLAGDHAWAEFQEGSRP